MQAIIDQNFEMTKKFVETNKRCVYDIDENDDNPLVLGIFIFIWNDLCYMIFNLKSML